MSVDYHHRGAHGHRTRGTLRLALSVSALAAAASWVVGCGESQPPVAVGDMPGLTVYVGSTRSVDLARYFGDPDGDALSYTATTSDPEVATASVSGNAVMVSGVSQGTADVTVTATDPDGLLATQAFTVTVRLTERQVLEILYDELDGENWDDNTNWKTDAPLELWDGVSTDADGSIVYLYLGDNSLTGEIPSELGNLSNLKLLGLEVNSLTGKIPPELGNLSNLELLGLSETYLDEIPPALGNLSNLEHLYLSFNQLTGEIPAELGNLANLRTLDLSGNSLTEIPPELGNLSNLWHLGLSRDYLGELPPELGNLSNLRTLDLSGNSLTEIPPELGNLANLEDLDLDDNSLTAIPLELGDLANLEDLDLDDNSLTAIPPELGDLANLEDLDLSGNSLTGEIPPELGDLANLEDLRLDDNLLTGEIPLDFLDLSSLDWFDWHDNDGLCAPNTRIRCLAEWNRDFDRPEVRLSSGLAVTAASARSRAGGRRAEHLAARNRRMENTVGAAPRRA